MNTKPFLILAVLISLGCAQTHKPANVPSVTGVRNDLQTAKAHIQQASESVKAAGGDATALDALIDKTDAKTVIILRGLEKYRPKP
jgi:hypothetical protein